VISKLIEAGYLKSERRHDADAIRNALDKLSSRPIDIFGRPGEDKDPTPGRIRQTQRVAYRTNAPQGIEGRSTLPVLLDARAAQPGEAVPFD
jgi:hypothetical protein